MKRRKYIQGMTFFVTPEMYQDVINMSNQQGISVSEVVRESINQHIPQVSANNQETKELSDGKS